MRKLFLSLIILTLFACTPKMEEAQKVEEKTETETTDKIHVLNFGSIHLSGSSDAHSSVIDVNHPQTKIDIKQIVEKLAKFKPTIICVEIPPESTDFMNETLQKYKKDRVSRINYSEEVNALGLEVARLSGAKKIYGIDSQSEFDYPSLMNLANRQPGDSLYVQSVNAHYEKLFKAPLLEQYREINSKSYKAETFDFYNFLATMHTPGNFEGANIIADFYERNLRMYSNFSDIPMTKNDRVLIIMGATHTAYFDVFLGNSPKYILEDLEKYTDYK